MSLLIMAGIIRSDLYLLLCCLAFFESTVRLWFLSWSSMPFAAFSVQVVAVWAEGQPGKCRDNLPSKGSAGWRGLSAGEFASAHCSLLSVWRAGPGRVKSVCFTGNWKKFMCASETERSNVWLISIDRWNEHNRRRQWLENKQVVWKYF